MIFHSVISHALAAPLQQCAVSKTLPTVTEVGIGEEMINVVTSDR